MCLDVSVSERFMGLSLMTFPLTVYAHVLHHSGGLPAVSSPLFSTTRSEAQLSYLLHHILAQLFWGGGV